MATPTVGETWDQYEQLRVRYKRRKRLNYGRAERVQKEQELGSYLAWCKAQQLPPLLFMAKRFEAMYRASRGLAVPRMSQLKSDKLARVWARIESDHYRDQQSERLHAEAVPADTLSIRELRADPAPYQETVKRRNVADPDGCLALFRHTGGYHPKSGWCEQCINQGVCQRQLRATYGFDVTALRLGRFQGLPNRVLMAALG